MWEPAQVHVWGAGMGVWVCRGLQQPGGCGGAGQCWQPRSGPSPSRARPLRAIEAGAAARARCRAAGRARGGGGLLAGGCALRLLPVCSRPGHLSPLPQRGRAPSMPFVPYLRGPGPARPRRRAVVMATGPAVIDGSERQSAPCSANPPPQGHLAGTRQIRTICPIMLCMGDAAPAGLRGAGHDGVCRRQAAAIPRAARPAAAPASPQCSPGSAEASPAGIEAVRCGLLIWRFVICIFCILDA